MSARALPLTTEVLARIHEAGARHGVRDIRLFGSHARGEAGPESDLDLLVRLESGRGFRDFMDFCQEVEQALGRRVDVVVEDGLSPYLRDKVLAEAVPL